jgi:hypothetical protein
VDAHLQSLLDFLVDQQARQAPHFPKAAYPKVLTFMGTTSLAGSHAAVGVHRLVELVSAGERELHVRLAGTLPRPPGPGECITVHLTDANRFRGFQVKTLPLSVGGEPSALYQPTPDGVVVRGSLVYTVHHSPYTMRFFERIPHQEVIEAVGGLRHALVAVGETANLSPRFVFHHEPKMGRPALFHGDGLALKTYMNLKLNRQETRLALDLDSFTGWALRGTVEEFQAQQYPEAYQKICDGFAAGSWGKPSRVFRLVADAWAPIAPAP